MHCVVSTRWPDTDDLELAFSRSAKNLGFHNKSVSGIIVGGAPRGRCVLRCGTTGLFLLAGSSDQTHSATPVRATLKLNLDTSPVTSGPSYAMTGCEDW